MSCPLPIDVFGKIYETLTPFESYFLIGVAPSIVKGVVALVQVITGIALALLSTPFFILFKSPCFEGKVIDFVNTAQFYNVVSIMKGIIEFVNSILNIETLGLMAYFNSREIAKLKEMAVSAGLRIL